ncbi:MAG: DUF4381 family protein [Desulforhopalus sp.]|nr:DUF4381 family protein [Desulforhopalus sp.]
MKRLPIALLPCLVLLKAHTGLAADQGEESLTLQNNKSQQIQNKNDILHDIQGPVPTSEYPPYLVETALVLLVLLAIGLLYFFLKRRKKPQPPPIPPWDTALSELTEAGQLMSAGQGLLYMDKVAQILRRYIESRFAIFSTRQTTREFFLGLEDSGPPSLLAYRSELRACLEQADMAKFAHLLPELQHMQGMEQAVRTFITSTRPELPTGGGRQ